MDQLQNRRIAAVKAADASNAIEGVPVSDYAKTLSACWANGEITDQQMKSALLASHRKLAARVHRYDRNTTLTLFTGRMQILHPSFYMHS